LVIDVVLKDGSYRQTVEQLKGAVAQLKDKVAALNALRLAQEQEEVQIEVGHSL